ncbi:hypothetical protein [Rhizobium lusitanum]|uniref:hypothetical protein n=1 Tax=Rhizobium lusitanum TaxID=293958 RepID=UPI001FEF76E6|nr:hypothetical protein [Rhizobium lusitanum]
MPADEAQSSALDARRKRSQAIWRCRIIAQLSWNRTRLKAQQTYNRICSKSCQSGRVPKPIGSYDGNVTPILEYARQDTGRRLTPSGRRQIQFPDDDLVKDVGFDAGLDEHLPGFAAEKGIGVRLEAEAPGCIVFLASDGRPTEKEVIAGFFRASYRFRDAITDTEIDGLLPTNIAGIEDHVHFDGTPTFPSKLLRRQKVSQFLENRTRAVSKWGGG